MASLCVDVGNSIGIYDAFQERKRQINHYKSRLLSTKKQAKRPPEASGPQTTTTGTTTGTTTTTTTTRTASNLIGVGESCKEDKQMVLMIAPPLENARQQCNMQVRVPFARLVIANDDDDDDECESIRLQELSALREHNEKEQQMIIKKSKREAPIESPERTTGGCRPAGKVSEPRELSCSLSSLLSSSSSELDSVCCREISTIKASCVNEAVDGRRGDALSEQDKHRGPSRGDDDDDDDDMNPMKSDNCCQSASISLANDDKETDTSSSSLSSFRPSSAGRNTLGAHSIKYESHSQPDYEMNATSGRQTSEHQWGRPRGLPETPARAQASERRNLRANNNNNNINTTLRHHKLRLPHQHHRRHNYHLHHRHHHLGWPAIGPTATAALLACLVATLITLTLTNSGEFLRPNLALSWRRRHQVSWDSLDWLLLLSLRVCWSSHESHWWSSVAGATTAIKGTQPASQSVYSIDVYLCHPDWPSHNPLTSPDLFVSVPSGPRTPPSGGRRLLQVLVAQRLQSGLRGSLSQPEHHASHHGHPT